MTHPTRESDGRTGARVRLVIAHISIYLAALIFVSPLVYAFFSALKPNEEIFSMPPTLIGSEVRWSNFAEVFEYGPFWTYIGNSLFVATAATLVVLAVSTTAGYAFGRLRWRGRDLVFILFLATLMVPAEVLVIPMFQVMQWFDWVNTYQALIFPFAFTAFGTFLMRQFFRGIPFELEEAARVDGRALSAPSVASSCRYPNRQSRCYLFLPSFRFGTATCGRSSSQSSTTS